MHSSFALPPTVSPSRRSNSAVKGGRPTAGFADCGPPLTSTLDLRLNGKVLRFRAPANLNVSRRTGAPS